MSRTKYIVNMISVRDQIICKQCEITINPKIKSYCFQLGVTKLTTMD